MNYFLWSMLIIILMQCLDPDLKFIIYIKMMSYGRISKFVSICFCLLFWACKSWDKNWLPREFILHYESHTFTLFSQFFFNVEITESFLKRLEIILPILDVSILWLVENLICSKSIYVAYPNICFIERSNNRRYCILLRDENQKINRQ